MILLVAATELGVQTGFHVSLVLTFLIGSAGAVCQNTMIALAFETKGQLLELYFLGTGVSGLAMNFFQMIAVLLFGTSTPTDRLEGTVFYYLMAIIISIANIIMFSKL